MTPQDAKYKRIVWRYNEDEEIKDSVLTTVTFGVASAPHPHTAVRILKQLSSDGKRKLFISSRISRKGFLRR